MHIMFMIKNGSCDKMGNELFYCVHVICRDKDLIYVKRTQEMRIYII